MNQFSGSVNWDNQKYSFNEVTIKDDYMEAIFNGTVKYESLDNLYVDINIDSPTLNIPNSKFTTPNKLVKMALDGWILHFWKGLLKIRIYR